MERGAGLAGRQRPSPGVPSPKGTGEADEGEGRGNRAWHEATTLRQTARRSVPRPSKQCGRRERQNPASAVFERTFAEPACSEVGTASKSTGDGRSTISSRSPRVGPTILTTCSLFNGRTTDTKEMTTQSGSARLGHKVPELDCWIAGLVTLGDWIEGVEGHGQEDRQNEHRSDQQPSQTTNPSCTRFSTGRAKTSIRASLERATSATVLRIIFPVTKTRFRARSRSRLTSNHRSVRPGGRKTALSRAPGRSTTSRASETRRRKRPHLRR